jgi:hypothetical protein
MYKRCLVLGWFQQGSIPTGQWPLQIGVWPLPPACDKVTARAAFTSTDCLEQAVSPLLELWRSVSSDRCQLIIGSCFQFEFKIKCLNSKTRHFYSLRSNFFEKLKNQILSTSTYKYCLRSKIFFKKSKKFKTNRLFYVSYFNFLYKYFLKFIV